MSLPARQTNSLTEGGLEITSELLLTLKPHEAPHTLVNGTVRKATVYRWVIILDAIREGYSAAVAAGRAGLGDVAVYEWLRRGQDGEYPFDAFFEAFQIARAAAEEKHFANIAAVALNEKNPQWTASAWILERTFPEKYSRRNVVKQENDRPKQFTLVIDQSGRVSDRIEQMNGNGREIPQDVGDAESD